MPESRDPKRARAARKPAAKKPAAKKTASAKTVARKTVARKTTRKPAPRPAPRNEDLFDDASDERDAAPRERPRLARPIAIAGTPRPGEAESAQGSDAAPSAFAGGGDGALPPSPFDEPSGATPAPAPSAPDIDNPRGELLVGLAALIVAVGVFLPWYKSVSFLDTSVSGWSSGTWGPMVFFLSLGAIAVVALRRLGVALAFPVAHGLVLEGIGWVSVVALMVKRLGPFTPDGFAVPGPFSGGLGYWLAILGSVGVALAAGRLSKDAPFVTVPGWFRSAAGKAGAAVLGLSLVAGAAFGVVNDFGTNARPAGFGSAAGNGQAPELQKGLPKCVSEAGFPVPAGVNPEQGFGRDEPEKICTAIFGSELSVKSLDKRYRAALKDAGWSFEVLETATGAGGNNARVYSITSPECGTMQILNTQEKRSVSLVIGPAFCRDLSQLQPSRPSN